MTDKQEVMMKLMEISGGIRTQQRGKHPMKKGQCGRCHEGEHHPHHAPEHHGECHHGGHGEHHGGCQHGGHGEHHGECQRGGHGEHHGECQRGGHGEHHGGCQHGGHGEHPHHPHHHPRMSPVTQNALYLLAEKGSLNQRNMANSLHVTGQAVSELLKKLEERELITKESGELNNENIISLTPKGAEIAKKVHDTMQGMSEEFFADFSQEEMETLYQLLLKVEQKLATRE